MAGDSVYISFTSEDFKKIFTKNKGSDFYFKLDKRISLESGVWSVMLLSFHNPAVDPSKHNLSICLDGVIESYVGADKSLPCIQRYPRHSLDTNMTLPLRMTRNYYEMLHVFLDGEQALLNQVNAKVSTIQLLFKQDSW